MILLTQIESKLEGDFYHQVKNDMEILGISEQIILSTSKEEIKEMLDEKIRMVALEHLLTKARSHSKVRQEIYTHLNGSSYFNDTRFSSTKAKLLFKFRTRMFGVRNNFRNKYSSTLCPLCGTVVDSQEHLFSCKIIRNYHTPSMDYNDIFSDEPEQLLKVSIELEKIVKIREELCPK